MLEQFIQTAVKKQVHESEERLRKALKIAETMPQPEIVWETDWVERVLPGDDPKNTCKEVIAFIPYGTCYHHSDGQSLEQSGQMIISPDHHLWRYVTHWRPGFSDPVEYS